jgi:WD40 repeat protein
LNSKNGEETQQLHHSEAVSVLGYSPDGRYLVVEIGMELADRRIALWDTSSWTRLITFDAEVKSVQFTEDNIYVVTISESTLDVWLLEDFVKAD